MFTNCKPVDGGHSLPPPVEDSQPVTNQTSIKTDTFTSNTTELRHENIPRELQNASNKFEHIQTNPSDEDAMAATNLTCTGADSIDLTGKVAIITGSSSGIGAVTAKLFAKHGATLTIIGRNETRLLEVAKACEEAKGVKPLCLLLDLTIDRNCEEVVRKTVEQFTKIDILVNCAGRPYMSSLFDTNMDAFDELIALNLRVPYHMTQLCAPHLKLTKGNIVNVFGAPLRVRPGFLPFAMIRDALERFTKAGAVELIAEGIRMNAVRPGLARTNFLENLNVDQDMMDAAYDKLSALIPNNVILSPEEVARTILFIVSDISPNMIGSSIVLDGGASSYS